VPHHDLLAPDRAGQLDRPLDEHPPVVGVHALAEQHLARDDRDHLAVVDQRAHLVSGEPLEQRQGPELRHRDGGRAHVSARNRCTW